MANQIVQLKDGENNLFPNSNMIGIDYNNIISGHPRKTYTAIQDCFIFGTGDNGEGLYIDSHYVFYGPCGFTFLLKKGQKVSMDGHCEIQYVYGLKYI